MTTAVLRSAQAGAILTALGLSAGLMTGVAEAEPPRDAHSALSPIFPGAGLNPDLNQRYGVSERIIGPPPRDRRYSLAWLPRGVRRGKVGPGRPALDHGGRRLRSMNS